MIAIVLITLILCACGSDNDVTVDDMSGQPRRVLRRALLHCRMLGSRPGGSMARTCAFVVILSLVAGTVAHADPRAPIADRDMVRAHHKKVAGAALIGVGSGLALVGQILFVHAALNPVSTHNACAMGYPDCNYEYLNPLEIVPGGVFVGVGGALLLTGIPLYIVGSTQMHRAERSRPTLTLAPQLGPQGAALSARIRF